MFQMNETWLTMASPVTVDDVKQRSTRGWVGQMPHGVLAYPDARWVLGSVAASVAGQPWGWA